MSSPETTEEGMHHRVFTALVLATIVAASATGGGGGADTTPPAGTACTSTALADGAADTTFALAGWADRDYDLVLPASHVCGRQIAVVLVLHGGGSNKEGMRRLTCPDGDLTSPGCLERVAAAAGMAVVFANGTNAPGGNLIDANGVRTWNAGGGVNGYICVSGYACNQDIDDIAYVRALLADLSSHIVVDGKHVFATGFSNGAAMTQRLACEAADAFAAVAPVSGENQFALAGCTPSQRVAVLDIHGTLDACWPYAGGNGGCIESGLYVSVDSTLAGWAARNGCGAASSTALPPIAGVADGTSVVRFDYAGCVAGGELEHLEVVGNGHYWPRGDAYASGAILGGTMSRQLDTGQAIVDFFTAHGRP
jgi:polyhydroxybutyrate depolymerase